MQGQNVMHIMTFDDSFFWICLDLKMIGLEKVTFFEAVENEA